MVLRHRLVNMKLLESPRRSPADSAAATPSHDIQFPSSAQASVGGESDAGAGCIPSPHSSQ
jgi:hypothetical protein